MLLFFNSVSTLPPEPPPSAQTPGNLLYGTDGYITVSGIDLGSTVDEIGIEWLIEQYYPDFAQARGSVSRTGRVTRGEFRIKCKLVEWQYVTLNALCGSYGTSSDANSEQFGYGILGSIAEVTNVVVTGLQRNDGKAFIAVLSKAYIELGNVELNESKETTLEVIFHGLFTATSQKRLPGYIAIAA